MSCGRVASTAQPSQSATARRRYEQPFGHGFASPRHLLMKRHLLLARSTPMLHFRCRAVAIDAPPLYRAYGALFIGRRTFNGRKPPASVIC